MVERISQNRLFSLLGRLVFFLAAKLVGEPGFEPGTSRSRTVRATAAPLPESVPLG